MGPTGYQLGPESLALPLVQPEYGAVKATIGIEILDGKAVIFFVSEKTHHSPSTKRNGSLAHRHRYAAYLIIFGTDGDVLNGAYAHLGSNVSVLLKLQGISRNS